MPPTRPAGSVRSKPSRTLAGGCAADWWIEHGRRTRYDLDEAEADWLSRRVRGDDGEQLAKASAAPGTPQRRRRVRRAGDAFRYDRELGPSPVSSPARPPRCFLLLCGHAQDSGVPAGDGPGWLGMTAADVQAHLAVLASRFGAARGGWRADLADNPAQLADDVQALLPSLNLVRIAEDDAATWWFSPTTARWARSQSPPQNRTRRDEQSSTNTHWQRTAHTAHPGDSVSSGASAETTSAR